jgi:hypothetical protein
MMNQLQSNYENLSKDLGKIAESFAERQFMFNAGILDQLASFGTQLRDIKDLAEIAPLGNAQAEKLQDMLELNSTEITNAANEAQEKVSGFFKQAMAKDEKPAPKKKAAKPKLAKKETVQ